MLLTILLLADGNREARGWGRGGEGDSKKRNKSSTFGGAALRGQLPAARGRA